eukprot:TRINITY_DN15830_c0_g1_i1.p1 TRINITY_DN15830_c0_g1~~TRINITY_DN15830_c0_g1_i1.p1  ORF type:complete len:116 (-),score=15.85 TRINITY_DN15830_c0_g1_i1:75-422(-)
MSKVTRQPKEVNQVHQQAILRQFIAKEEETARNFESNWGYLKGDISTQLRETAAASPDNAHTRNMSTGVKEVAAHERALASSARFRTTHTSSYGGSRSLEIFGVAEHAIRVPKFD